MAIKCPDCKGKGFRVLHGHAFTPDELDELGTEFLDNMINGDYNTTCETCGGSGETTQEELEYQALVQSELRAMRY